jgi:hypothetical protein
MKKALAISVTAFLVLAGYLGWDYFQNEARLREQVRQLQEVVTRLNAEYRVAQIIVHDQTVDAEGRTLTTLEFREVSRDNELLPPISATLVGTEVYFESLVIKFQNQYVEQGDALRGKSIILFRRMFGSGTAPDDGVPIDRNASNPNGIPDVYRVSKQPSELEVDLWNKFWFYANNTKEAAAKGVRVMQLEAIGTRVEPSRVYELRVENDGGMSLIPTP